MGEKCKQSLARKPQRKNLYGDIYTVLRMTLKLIIKKQDTDWIHLAQDRDQ
jgi:hypothetical protein